MILLGSVAPLPADLLEVITRLLALKGLPLYARTVLERYVPR